MLTDKTYLGDGVYAAHDGWHIWLWTSDGIENGKPIALEPAVIDALLAYRGTLLERIARPAGEDDE